MAVHATINIPIDPDFIDRLKKFMAEAQRFQAKAQQSFQQRQAQAGQPPPQRLLNDFTVAIRKITRLIEKMALSIERITDRLINNTMGFFGKAFMGGLRAMMPFLETLMPVVGFLAGPVGWIISGATFIYTVGKYSYKFVRWIYDKMIGLGEAMFKDMVLASGVGATFGGLRAFRTIFGGLPISDEMFRTAARGRGDPTSLAMGTLLTLGIKNAGDTADMLVQMLLKGRRYLMQFAPNVRISMAKAIGLEEWFGRDLITALPKLREEEIREMARQYQEAKKAMQMTPKAIEGWKNFSVMMKTIGPRILTILGEALANPKTGLLKQIMLLFDAFNKFIIEITKTKLSDKATSIIAQWIHDLTEYLNSGRAFKGMKAAATEIRRIVRSLNEIRLQIQRLLDFIHGVDKGPKPYTTIDSKGRITLHYRPGDRGTHVGRQMRPQTVREREERTGVPRTRRGAGPESTGPLPSEYPTGPPGTRYDPISATSIGGGVGSDSASMGRGRHQGVDLMAPVGSPVYADMDGTIERFGTDNFGQPTVTIRHADGTYSRYLHMHSRMGKVGDHVHGGQQIGTSGTANGVPHLHFERWFGPPNARGSRLLDPMKENDWRRRTQLPRGGQPSRTNTDQTPPAERTPPDARRVQPRPPTTAQPTPDPETPPILRPRQGAPHISTPAPPSGRRTTPTPRQRPPTSTSETPTTPAPTPTPGRRPTPPSGRRTAPVAPAAPAPAPAPAPVPSPTPPAPSPAPGRDYLSPRDPAYPRGGPQAGVDLYNKLLTEFRANPPKVAPEDAARFGIVNNTPEEWARFGVAVANEESGFDARSTRVTSKEKSYGVFQYDHSQVDNGNAYDIDASVRAFVRDANNAARDGRISGSVLAKRFATIGNHPNRAIRSLPLANQVANRANVPVQPTTPRPWGGEDIRRTLVPGARGTPSGAAPVRPPPIETTPEALRPGMPGTPGGPAPVRPGRPALSASSPPTPQPGVAVRDRTYDGYSPLGYQTAEQAGIKPEFPVAENVNWRLMKAETIARLNEQYRSLTPDQQSKVKMISGFRPATRAEARKLGMDEHSSQEDIWERYTGTGQYKGLRPGIDYHKPAKAAKPFYSKHQQGESGDFEGSEHMKNPRGGLTGIRGDEPHVQTTEPRSDTRPGAATKREQQRQGINPATGQPINPSSQPSDTSVSPSVSSQPSNRPVNAPAEPVPGYTATGARAAPSGEDPVAVVFHHTGDRNSARKTVESWRSETGDRKGVGAQYIIDRDGTVHDVLKEYKYGGTDNVARKYTPQELIDKGIVNRNIVGIELIAKNDKDVTPAQIAAAKKLMRQHYRHAQVRTHGELNPLYEPDAKGPHRDASEGKTVADEIRKERAKDPDYIEPGSAGEYLKKHLKEFEEKGDKEPGQPDTQADKVTLAQADLGTRTDAPLQQGLIYGTVEAFRGKSPIIYPGLTAEQAVSRGAGPEFLEGREKELSTETEDRRDESNLSRYIGVGWEYTKHGLGGGILTRAEEVSAAKNIQPSFGVDWGKSIDKAAEIGPPQYNTQTGEKIIRPGEVDLDQKDQDKGMTAAVSKFEDTSTQGDESGGAAAFLRNQFKNLQQQREEGKRGLAGFAQEASAKPITSAKGYDPAEKHIKNVEEGESFTGRLTPYAPGAGGTIEGGPEARWPSPGQPTLSEVNSVRSSRGQPALSQTQYEQTYQKAQTLDDVRLGNSKFVTIASDENNRDQKFTIDKITYTSPIDGKTYTLRNVKAYVHDKGSAFKNRPDKFDVAVSDYTLYSGRDKSEKLKKMDREPWGQEDPSDFKKGWNDEPTTVDGKEIQLANRGGVGGDAARDAQIQKELDNREASRHPEAESRSPAPRTRMPGNHEQNVKINKPHDADFDVVQHGPKNHGEHDSHPSADDKNDDHVDTRPDSDSHDRGGGGSSGEELNL